jgi:hypothetical protein
MIDEMIVLAFRLRQTVTVSLVATSLVRLLS